MVNQALIEQGSSVTSERIAAIDATFVPKSGKKTEGLGQFYNGCHSKSQRGLEWSVLSIIDLQQNTAYALNAMQTLPISQEKKEKREESQTLQYLAQVKTHREAIAEDVRYLVADGYYSKKPWIDGIRKLNLHAIGKLRRDADLKYFYTGPVLLHESMNIRFPRYL